MAVQLIDNSMLDKLKKMVKKETSAEEEEVLNTEEGTEKKKKKSKRKSKTDKLQEEIDELTLQVNESKDKYLRLFAEFDNYKKRTLKEKIEYMKTASAGAITAMLPVLDDFDRAKKSADDDATDEYFTEGVQMIYNKIFTVLKNQGLEAMESTGEPFDPELHEAITEIPAPSEEMKGKVIDTVEKGYTLKDKIIRHAKVVVGK